MIRVVMAQGWQNSQPLAVNRGEWDFCTPHTEICSFLLPIRESVDSLCRDGTDTPIVCVHMKAF